MHLLTILAFGILFLRAEQSAPPIAIGSDRIALVLAMVLFQPVVFGGIARLFALRAERLLERNPGAPQIAQHFHHRVTWLLRTAIILIFAATVFFTPWPEWFAFRRINPWLQILGDAIVLLPFVGDVVALWVAAFPLERKLREDVLSFPAPAGDPSLDTTWRLAAYLDFQLRHQVLVVAVPMLLILFAADLTRAYEQPLRAWTGLVWAPELVLGGVALTVFAVSPLLLIRIWRTEPLKDGPVRRRLEDLGRRIGLRFRDVLVWRSDGLMINAAVMGLLPRVRYVLLSDAMLAAMSPTQIEAVFGHEAGHIRHHHIQHFLIFALMGWLLTTGLMEACARLGGDAGTWGSPAAVQVIGIVVTVLYWAVGFGWLSRRFERQADLFGARAVTPSLQACELPCSVHGEDAGEAADSDRVCATGATVFASALDSVAILNGIPHEERSWRHSSIGGRIRFLMSLAGDPLRAARFERLLEGVKLTMLAVTIIAAALWLYYWLAVGRPAILEL